MKLKPTHAFAEYYKKTDHGITLTIRGTKDPSFTIGTSLSLNVYGGIWNALPAGVDTVVKFTYMPYTLYSSSIPTNNATCSGSRDWELKIKIATKEGTPGVKHSTIATQLKTQVESGDPLFEIVFYSLNQEIFSIVTKPSLILNCLESHGDSIIYAGVAPNLRKTTIPDWIRWHLFPVIYTILIWLLYFFDDNVKLYTPKFFFKSVTTTIASSLPIHPKNLSQSWKLGQLDNQLRLAEANNNSTMIDEILTQVTAFLGRAQKVTAEQLHSVEELVVQIDSEESVMQKVYGFFSFVNIIWLIAILGIATTCGPFLFLMLKPLRRIMTEIAVFIFRRIILPLHKWGFFEMCAYAGSFQLVIEGMKTIPDMGLYVSFTGLALLVPCYLYSALLHMKEKRDPHEQSLILISWLLTILVPVAIVYQSTLIGWISVLLIYHQLGFSFICFGLCYLVGFSSDDAMERVSATSFLLLTSFIGLRIAKFNTIYLMPFASASLVMGSTLLLLALLIWSSKFYRYNRRNNYKDYYLRQVPILVIMMSLIFFGSVWSLPSILNTGLTFMVLYGLEKFCEAQDTYKWNFIVVMFLGSVLLYYIAVYLHSNPEFIVSMFDTSQTLFIK